MNRPGGVVVSAVILALISLFQLLMALGMVLSGHMEPLIGSRPGVHAPPPIPGWMPLFMYGLAVLFLAVAGWGIATTAGILRLRQWARYSILVYGGGMALVGFFSLLIMIVLMVVGATRSIPANTPQPENLKPILEAVFGSIALFYAVVTGIGIWWLFYFSLKKVRQAFAGAGARLESRRPVLIAVFAALLLVGAPACLAMAFVPLPAAFFGLALHGWPKIAFCILSGGVNAAAGIGLWRMREWARKLALGVVAFGAANSAVFALRPSLMVGYAAGVNQTMNAQQIPLSEHMQAAMYAASSTISILLLVAIAAMLHHYRARFAPAVGSQPT